MPTSLAVQTLGSRLDGTDKEEAARRLRKFVANALPLPTKPSAIRRFIAQFNSVFIFILLATVLITALLGHFVDSAVIAGVVLANAVIGYVQEGKAEDALDAIRHMLSLNAVAMRAGQRGEMSAEMLVPGDLVFLSTGDKVPADLRLLEVHGLQIDEAMLTGESMPVGKQIDPVTV